MDLGIRAWAHGLKDSHLRGFGFRVWGSQWRCPGCLFSLLVE